jgi:hypothetical protein
MSKGTTGTCKECGEVVDWFYHGEDSTYIECVKNLNRQKQALAAEIVEYQTYLRRIQKDAAKGRDEHWDKANIPNLLDLMAEIRLTAEEAIGFEEFESKGGVDGGG